MFLHISCARFPARFSFRYPRLDHFGVVPSRGALLPPKGSALHLFGVVVALEPCHQRYCVAVTNLLGSATCSTPACFPLGRKFTRGKSSAPFGRISSSRRFRRERTLDQRERKSRSQRSHGVYPASRCECKEPSCRQCHLCVACACDCHERYQLRFRFEHPCEMVVVAVYGAVF